MRQTKKGKAWHFGLKLHVGTDPRGLVHSVVVTDAAQADIKQLSKLLHGEERKLYGDQAYWSERDRQAFEARDVVLPAQVSHEREARQPEFSQMIGRDVADGAIVGMDCRQIGWRLLVERNGNPRNS